MTKRPVIGLSSYRQQAAWGAWDHDVALVPSAYVDCVAAAGGLPVVLPPAGVGNERAGGAARLVGAVDALVLIGGADVDPDRYGQAAHTRTGEPQPWRDDHEVTLLDATLTAGTPVLAICRGMQVLNVHLGGTLEQHVPDGIGHEEHQPAPGCFGESKVIAEPGSRVAAVMGERFTVACCHHQAVDRLGDALVVTARADDGVVEAIERPGDAFVVGVQWHPEETSDVRLFEALVAAC